MSSDNDWQRDYSLSLKEDEKVLCFMSGCGYSGQHVDFTIKNPDFDAVLYKNGKSYPIEIKNDFKAVIYKNFFVETGNFKGEESGLTVTEASHCIFTIPQSGLLYAIKVPDLRSIVMKGKQVDHPTLGRLLPVSLVADYSKRYYYT